jgi:hypothetical protein
MDQSVQRIYLETEDDMLTTCGPGPNSSAGVRWNNPNEGVYLVGYSVGSIGLARL